MSTLKTNKFQHVSATGTNTNIELDASRNVTCKNDLTVDGDLTVTGSNNIATSVGGATGIDFNNDVKIRFGTGNKLQIYHTGSHSYISNDLGDLVLGAGNGSSIKLQPEGGEDGLTVNQNGSCQFYFDDDLIFYTNTDIISFPDNKKIFMGESNDLQIYHTGGGDNYIYGGAQSLKIQVAGGENAITCVNEAQVELYHNNLLRFYTESTGNCARLDTYGTNAFKLRNLDTTAGAAHTNQIYFNFSRTGGSMDNPGAKIVAGKEQEWIGASSNQDGYLAFETMLNESINEKFRIAANGDLTATDTSISSNSDSRLKTNIADYTYDLTKFKQLQPKTFDWRNPAMHGNKSGVRGFVAQDLEAVDSYWVSSEKVVSTYGITEDDAVPNPDLSLLDADGIAKTSKLGQKDAMYISVINQLVAKIETLETKVAALEAA